MTEAAGATRGSRSTRPGWRYAGRLAVLVVLVAVAGTVIGEVLEDAAEGEFRADDVGIATWLHNRTCDRTAWLIALVVSELGRPIFLYLLVGAGLVACWRRDDRATIAYLVITGLSGGLVDTIIKLAVARRRPGLGGCNIGLEGKSFPSGHTLSSTIAYGALLVVFLPLVQSVVRRRLVVAGVIVILLAIGVARLAVGAHYTSDIVAGYLIGAGWLVVATWAFRRWCSESARPG